MVFVPILREAATKTEKNFNVFHSRCIVKIEPALGILVSKFSIYWSPIRFRLAVVTRIIGVTYKLHNFAMSHPDERKFEQLPVHDDNNFISEPISYLQNNLHAETGIKIRRRRDESSQRDRCKAFFNPWINSSSLSQLNCSALKRLLSRHRLILFALICALSLLHLNYVVYGNSLIIFIAFSVVWMRLGIGTQPTPVEPRREILLVLAFDNGPISHKPFLSPQSLHSSECSESTSMILWKFITVWEIVDYFFNEPKMLHKWDILDEHFSVMCYWVTMCSFCFPSTFRTSTCSLQATEWAVTNLGETAKVIDGLLLSSGFFVVDRDFNYTIDCMVAPLFCIHCGLNSSLPYFYFIYLFFLTLYRENRAD